MLHRRYRGGEGQHHGKKFRKQMACGVYAGLAILNPSARTESTTEIFILMLVVDEQGLHKRMYEARYAVLATP
jgi:hypothetical protein